MLLRDLTIENFRSFEKYQLNGLARVNLLVGDNNCGKTSVLEAVCLLASEGDLQAFRRIAEYRGEVCATHSALGSAGGISHGIGQTFSRERFEFGSVQLIRLYTESLLRVAVWFGPSSELQNQATAEFESLAGDMLGHIFEDDSSDAFESFPKTMIAIVANPSSGSELTTIRGVSSRGDLPLDDLNPLGEGSLIPVSSSGGNPVAFLSLNGLTGEGLREDWNHLLRTRTEKGVVSAIRTVFPEVEELMLLAENSPIPGSKLSFLVGTTSGRYPLSSYGEGTQRMVAIGAAIGVSAGGTALVDEIDTGLHYSRLKDMWRMVIKAAQELDVQVFATTHSLDCIRGLDEAIQDDESLASDVALFSIDRRMKEAVRYDAHELSVVVDHRIEVR